MRDYELQAHLITPDGGEWTETTSVQAQNLVTARIMARRFAILEAQQHNAKVDDFWAIDLESYEVSD